MIPGSSMVEQEAVNFEVAGSSPVPGAIDLWVFFSWTRSSNRVQSREPLKSPSGFFHIKKLDIGPRFARCESSPGSHSKALRAFFISKSWTSDLASLGASPVPGATKKQCLLGIIFLALHFLKPIFAGFDFFHKHIIRPAPEFIVAV